MTDQELEQLLRETFADKEKLADDLPQATKSRRPAGPVLLAAAAVLAVLGGILYGVDRGPHADPAPPVAVAPADDDAEIWGAAITAVTLRFQPKYGLDTVLLQDRTAAVVMTQRASNVRALSAAQMDRIAHLVTTAARVQVRWVQVRWDGPQPYASTANCSRTLAYVSVGDVVDKGDHREVPTNISYNCGHGYALTYRVEKRGETWSVTGTVGLGEGVAPAGCPFSGPTPARQRDGC